MARRTEEAVARAGKKAGAGKREWLSSESDFLTLAGMARSHAQRRYCARWRPHDRLFDRIETCENRFDPLCRELIKGVLSNTRPNPRLDRRLFGRMCSRAAISVLIAAQPLHGEQFRGNCVELFFKREQRRIVC
jgi:hypothetical protein